MAGKELQKPDGGCLAWTVVAASFTVSLVQVLLVPYLLVFAMFSLQDGFRDSFGLFLLALTGRLGVTKAEATLTASLMTLLTLGSGPLVATAVERFGHRAVSAGGTVLAATGLAGAGLYLTTAAQPSLTLLYLCLGGATGLGFGLMFLPAIDIIPLHFRHQPLTSSIVKIKKEIPLTSSL